MTTVTLRSSPMACLCGTERSLPWTPPSCLPSRPMEPHALGVSLPARWPCLRPGAERKPHAPSSLAATAAAWSCLVSKSAAVGAQRLRTFCACSGQGARRPRGSAACASVGLCPSLIRPAQRRSLFGLCRQLDLRAFSWPEQP